METLAALANFFDSILSPIASMALRIGADEDDAGLGERLREGRALGEEAVARMHRLGARLLAGRDDLVDREIGLRRRGRADGDRLVGHLDVQRVLVGLGIDGDGLDPHSTRGLDDPAGDFAAVGDQNLLEHLPPVARKARVLSDWGRSIGRRPAGKQDAAVRPWQIDRSPRRPLSARNQYQSQIWARSQPIVGAHAGEVAADGPMAERAEQPRRGRRKRSTRHSRRPALPRRRKAGLRHRESWSQRLPAPPPRAQTRARPPAPPAAAADLMVDLLRQSRPSRMGSRVELIRLRRRSEVPDGESPAADPDLARRATARLGCARLPMIGPTNRHRPRSTSSAPSSAFGSYSA